MNSIQETCSNPDLQAQIAFHVAWAAATGSPPLLQPECTAHLQSCSSCRDKLEAWRIQGNSMREEVGVIELTRLALEGDPSIVTRTTAEGIAYFRPDEGNGSWGLMVLRERTPPHFRLAARRMLRSEFDAMN